MKLSNIFKKNTKTTSLANVEKLEKNQLEKVIGGADSLGQGASLLGGAMPTSTAVTTIGGGTSKSGGASSSSYAAG